MSQYSTLRLVNAIVIGYMVGTREVIGRGGAQAVANLAGEYAGRELVRFAREQGVALSTMDDLVAYASEEGLAGQMVFEEVESGFEVRIAQCYIWPKKVGHYQFSMAPPARGEAFFWAPSPTSSARPFPARPG